MRTAILTAALLLPLTLAVSCGSEPKYDPNNRELPWSYGPQTGTARPEHLTGTGKKGGRPVSEGWKCRLVDGNKLTINPYQLSAAHPLFDKAKLMIGLFSEDKEQLQLVYSDVIAAKKASFSFDVTADVAKKLFDVVIWFRVD